MTDARRELTAFIRDLPAHFHAAVLLGALDDRAAAGACAEAAAARGEMLAIAGGPSHPAARLLPPAPPSELGALLTKGRRAPAAGGKRYLLALWVDRYVRDADPEAIVQAEWTEPGLPAHCSRLCVYGPSSDVALEDEPFFKALQAHSAVFLPRDEDGRTLVVRTGPGAWFRPGRTRPGVVFGQARV